MMTDKKDEEKSRSARRLTYKEYYEENKERIAEFRRNKYRTDPEHREKVRTYAKLRWKLGDRGRVTKRQRRIQRARADINLSYRRNSTRKLMQRVIQKDDGTEIVVKPMAELCLRTGAPKHSIKRWTQRGVLPKPTMVDDRGRFWYSDKYIEDLAGCYEKCRASNWSLEDFRDALKKDLPDAEW